MNSSCPDVVDNRPPLVRLIDTRLPDIVRKELGSKRIIRLYKSGDYWCAFEESAYLLSRFFKRDDVTVIHHKEYPFPVVMAGIPDEDLRAWGKSRIFRKKLPEYREIIMADDMYARSVQGVAP